MSANIELKAACRDLAAAKQIALASGARLLSIERQTDTYFRTASGRLKLRRRWVAGEPNSETWRELPAQLILYDRPDQAQARTSHYEIIECDRPELFQTMLFRGMSLWAQVKKHRTVYLRDNVRIHLDEVQDLGTFLEFEAIVDGTCDETAARRKVEQLEQLFAIKGSDLLQGSYSDLMILRSRLDHLA